MAVIRKISNLSWEIEVYCGSDAVGQPIRHRCTYRPAEKAPTKARKEVERYAAEYEERIRQGKYLDGDKMTFLNIEGEFSRLSSSVIAPIWTLASRKSSGRRKSLALMS